VRGPTDRRVHRVDEVRQEGATAVAAGRLIRAGGDPAAVIPSEWSFGRELVNARRLPRVNDGSIRMGAASL
jgi:hypothetical protein